MPLSVPPPTSCQSVECIETFFARELGCSPTLLSEPGIHVITSPNRERPGWCDFSVPFLLLSRKGSTVVSVSEQLLPRVQGILDRLHPRRLVGEAAREVKALLEATCPDGKHLWGHALYCDPARFKPTSFHPTEKLLPHDPEWEAFKEHFDGPVFVTRAPDGEVVSWSAIKLKSDEVWEIAVTTEEPYRGRGLAKVVASAATRYILECGRVPLYVHDETNVPSGRVARSLGYVEFGREAFCSLTDPSRPNSMW